LDVVAGVLAGVRAHAAADDEGDGFGLGLPDREGGLEAALALVEQRVGDLVDRNGEFLGRL